MTRHRLGVLLLLPGHISTEIDGLRRALGVHPVDRVPPHITLVAPINVADDDMDAAVALATRVASEQREPLHVVVGPVRTFSPITPVIYFEVSGPGLDAIRHLRDELDAGPFAQELAHEYVPHVTLNDDATDDELHGALASLTHFREVVRLDGITVMEQGDDKVWRAIADAPFGAESTTRTLGADRVRIATSTHETPRGSRIGRYRPLIVEAFVDDRPVAIARGRLAQGDVAWLDELVVAGEQRGSGVGGAVARAFVEAARDREATEVRSARGATIAGFLVKLGFSQTDTKEFVLPL